MIDHIGIKVSDFTRSRTFYEQALKPLGYTMVFTNDREQYAGFAGPDGERIWIARGDNRGSIHVAVKAVDRATVRRFHHEAIKAGGRDNGAAGLRPQYSPTYYGAFVIDPDGHNLEAVCFNEE